MSTLKVNDIIEATSGGGKVFPCRAWVRFSTETSTTLQGSEGVSSLTDNGTGLTTVTLSTAFTNIYYAVPAAAADTTAGSARRAMPGDGGVNTTTTIRIAVDNSSTAETDTEYVHAAFFGNHQ
jgi:hypothetical protein